ncbi:MAG: GAF domain-containing protein [bacterium]|nr:GAF domain-containing protein [bacterium]MCP5071203.1 GAF domain-containing protein [bacterium]
MSNDVFERADEVLGLFRRGAEFTRELLEENKVLRQRLARVESHQQDAAQDNGEWDKLRSQLLERIQGLECEHQDAIERVAVLEDENMQFAGRYLEIEEENNALANLYVASFQLHSTLDLSEVFRIVIEIVINLIGAEVFAVYALDEKSGVFEPVASEGVKLSNVPTVQLGQGLIGGSVTERETAFADPGSQTDLSRPLVSIPLCVDDRAIGAIAIFKLLTQKKEFSPLDHELFTLLAGHAATAIFAAQLYSQSERKLNTIQGFIDLLTK